ncbi:uncharacterized protein LOC100678927 [Nasonia vitripennis]|uniref:Uncharacterized protein n=1 Tax=Nasonia vitripennis TaxID=7425 RepID=A0A7M7M1W1_NASVI|nr:uncharacterized protein LOC100678927 [Nasonia vitripennis]
MACLKNILFFGLVVLFYLANATAQEAAGKQEVDTPEVTHSEGEGEDDYYDEDDAPIKNPTELDEQWVKNLIGVQMPDLSDNCFEIISKHCAEYAGNNEKTLHCAASYQNFEVC